MLVRLSVENFRSFDVKEEISMISSSKIQERSDHRIKIRQTNILRHGAVYGANASGKSNLVSVFAFFRTVLLEGLPVNCRNQYCRNRSENRERESMFEMQFTAGDRFYAYGFSAVLSKRMITEEWLYELMQDGSAHPVFERKGSQAPVLGNTVRLSASERNRFSVYADDFAGHSTGLFLTEMNRGKRYDEKSGLLIFRTAFLWMTGNIVIIRPDMGMISTDSYYSKKSLEQISELIRTFDTGVTKVETRTITPQQMSQMIPEEILNEIFNHLQKQLNMTDLSGIRMTWRMDEGFFSIRLSKTGEPEIRMLVLRHGSSDSCFGFEEESDGTKRLFDLVGILTDDHDDTLFVIDELERSLHPKLTEHFLRLFMDAHQNSRTQLIFTTHEASLMDQNLFRRDEIWFVERDSEDASHVYSLDRFKERYDRKLSKAYLEGRYGAIPVLQTFEFRKG